MVFRRFASLVCVLTLSLTALSAKTLAAVPAQDEDLQQRQLLQLIQETSDSLAEGNWLLATQQFDTAWAQVCFGEDPVFVLSNDNEQQLEPGQSELLAGGRARLEDLYFSAPVEFHREYRRQYEQIADSMLSEGVSSGQADDLRKCVQRFPFTTAAQSALRLLIQREYDRGRMMNASLDSGQLLQLLQRSGSGAAEVSRARLRHACLLWQAELGSDAVDQIQRLMREVEDGVVRLGDQRIELPSEAQSIEVWLAETTGTAAADQVTRWRQPLGSYRRVRYQPHGPAELQPDWSSDLFHVHRVIEADDYNPILQGVPERLELLAALKTLDNGTIFPVASPLIVNDQVVFRTPTGIRSVAISSGELQWEVVSPDSQLRRTISAAGGRARSELGGQMPAIQNTLANGFLNQMTRSCPDGQMSTDGRTLYVIEDSIRASSGRFSGFGIGGSLTGIPANYIRAYDIQTGLEEWEAGGQRTERMSPNILAGFYFLGAPLILGDRCYVLAENPDGIYLLQLEGPSEGQSARSRANPRILHSQLLAIPTYGLDSHPVRRLAGLTPSFAGGLLICPTGDERVVAVSAQDHSVRWVFRYDDNVVLQDFGGEMPVLAGSRDTTHSEAVDLDTRWVDTMPRVKGDRVLITPRDANHLLCLDLNTGQEIWRHSRGFSRCIAAVTQDLVVLTGNKQIMALRLSDGAVAWKTLVPEGQICGTGLCDGNILQLPTTEPSIQSFELQTGRKLLSQSVRTQGVPGNLRSFGEQVIWQSLTKVSSVAMDPGTVADSATHQATQLLLRAEVGQATALLENAVSTVPDDSSARELLIRVMLESLRLDYTAHSASVPRLRSLIGQETVRTDDLVPFVESMLGMNLNDAAVLPMRLESLNRAEKQTALLFELVAGGLVESRDAPIAELCTAIGNMLPDLRNSQELYTTSGFLSRRNALSLATSMKRVIGYRSPDDIREVHRYLEPLLAKELDACTFAEGVRFSRMLQLAGLPETAATAASLLTPETPSDAARRQSLSEQFTLDTAKSLRGEAATEALQTLLRSWQERPADGVLETAVTDLTQHETQSPEQVLGLQCVDPDAVRAALGAEAELVAAAQIRANEVWPGTPEVTASDDRTTRSPSGPKSEMPMYAIPLFGDGGLFRHWSFVQEQGQRTVIAFDPYGRRRWEFDPEVTVSPLRTGRLQESYLLACGQLLAVKLQNHLHLIDTRDASTDSAPTRLWSVDLLSINSDEASRDFRQFTPGSERIEQYAPSPAGYFPIGPLTSRALPVLSGRRIVVFDPVTGDRLWQLNGLALDTVLLGDADRILLVSVSSRQVETRDLTSGELLSVDGLPDWWLEVETNVGMSTRDVDIEPGSTINWRVAVFDDRCLLFRLSPEKAELQLRSVDKDSLIWSKSLPADTTFSNREGNCVALLSEGNQLRLLRVDSGEELCHLEVDPVAAPRELYLRKSLDRWLVLPEGAYDIDDDFDPVMSSLHIHGQLYAIDASTMELAWQQPIEHLHIRQLLPNQFPIVPNAPILALISRYRRNTEFSFSSHMRAQVFDVFTGRQLYDSGGPKDENYDDLGRTLNGHGLLIDAEAKQLILGFESRDITFDYSQNQN